MKVGSWAVWTRGGAARSGSGAYNKRPEGEKLGLSGPFVTKVTWGKRLRENEIRVKRAVVEKAQEACWKPGRCVRAK